MHIHKTRKHLAVSSSPSPPDFLTTMSTSNSDLIPPPTEINDSHKNYAFGIACIVMGILGTLSILGRLVIRYHFRSFGADDYAIIPAMVRESNDHLC